VTTNLHFTQEFAPAILAGLDCYDRLIFKGHLPFGGDGHLNAFVDGVLSMRRKDFIPFVEQHAQTPLDSAKKAAADAGAPYPRLGHACTPGETNPLGGQLLQVA
jgi:hypothetical protein